MKSVIGKTVLATALVVALSATAFAAGSERAQVRSEIGPTAALGAQSSNGKISFTLSNSGDTSLFLLRYQTPFAGLTADLFDVRLNGQPVRYIGAKAKRAAPTAADFVELQAGESRQVTVDLAANYDMSQSGMYEVRFKAEFDEAFTERDERTGKRIAAVEQIGHSAGASYLWVDGMQAQLSHQAMLQAGSAEQYTLDAAAAISYTSCSSSQQSALPNALSQALSYATNASNYLNAGTAGARYTTWFGTYSSTRYDTVKSHFSAIKSALGTKPIAFDCSCTDSGTYAYVYPTQPYKIYVCGAFWSAPNSGTDSRGGTIVHETSHFDVVAGTDDLAYGQTAAKRLAQRSPAKAIKNADSHEYFGENTPFQN